MALFDSHPRYTIDPMPLGAGGMGTVFKGFDKKLNRLVAIKVMNAVLLKEDDVKRFEREAQNMAHMQHPHICPIHDFDRIDGHPYLVMDLIQGRSLQDILENSWPPLNRDIAKWISQVARALKHAHSKNVRHRDIKPANIMISVEGDAILMDFGLAQNVETMHSLTQSGDFMGTPAYASPEQARDAKTIDHRGDIYSLGVVLYVLLCRKHPYEGRGLGIVMQLREGKPFSPPSVHNKSADAELEAICLKAAALNPEDRYQSMAEFASALEEYLQANLIAAAKEDTVYWLEKGADASSLATPSTENPQSENVLTPNSKTVAPVPVEPLALGPTLIINEFHDTQCGDLAGETQTGLCQISNTHASDHDARRLNGLRMISIGIGLIVAVLIWFFINIPKDKGPLVNLQADFKSDSLRTGAFILNPPLNTEKPALLIAPFDDKTAVERQQAWAKYLGKPDFVETNSIGMKMVLIPPGEFMMGSTPEQIEQVVKYDSSFTKEMGDDEQPLHRARITQPFMLGQYEVTRGQFAAFANEMGYRTEAETDGQGGWGYNEATGEFVGRDTKYTWKATGFPQENLHPVVNVTWNDIMRFCEWLTNKEGVTYRLPTEAEWEYACRAGTTSLYYYGDKPKGFVAVGNAAIKIGADRTAEAHPSDQWNTIAAGDGFAFTAPVGQFRANVFNLYDMHGNVWEWCTDWYVADYYSRSPVDDPKGANSASDRVVRGGSWNYHVRYCRSADRWGSSQGNRSSILGFRVVAVLSVEPSR